MSDPFHPSRSFDAIAADLPDAIDTAWPDRARQFFDERPALAAGKTVRLIGERPGQLAFLKQLPVDTIEVGRAVTLEEEAAADDVVQARRGDERARVRPIKRE